MSLEALAAEAAALDRQETAAEGPAGAPGAVPELAPAAAQSAEMLDALELAASMLPEDSPFLKHFPKDRRAAISQAWGPLAVKRGWNLGNWLAGWGEEIAFGMALAPAVFGVLRDLRAAKLAKIAQPKNVKPAVDPLAPGPILAADSAERRPPSDDPAFAGVARTDGQ